jgi:RNA polymerase sigma-70 factor (ECF subfamily)
MPTDAELMAAVARGQASALAELYRRWERPLHQFLYRHLGGREVREVEDVAQETWIRVARAAPRFDPARRFSTWLFQIALNLCRDWHRRTPPPPADPATLEHMPAEGDPVAAAGMRLDAARLLAALPEGQRSAVILRYYHDLPEDEIATILGIPRGTVKSRLHGALARLVAVARGTPELPHDV